MAASSLVNSVNFGLVAGAISVVMSPRYKCQCEVNARRPYLQIWTNTYLVEERKLIGMEALFDFELIWPVVNRRWLLFA